MCLNIRLIGNSMDSTCHNTYDFPDERILKDYYNAETRHDNTCPSWAEQLLSYGIRDLIVQCSKSNMVDYNYMGVNRYRIQTVLTLLAIGHAQCTIWVTAVAMVFARIVVYKITRITKCQQIYVFILEFFVISVPAILSVTILNPYVEYMIVFIFIAFTILVIRSKCFRRAAQRDFEYGRRPFVITFQRSILNFMTVLCILAVDFRSFPKSFRKTRRFGAGLMDAGIGLIVIKMGLVQSRPKRLADILSSLNTVSVLLVLGLARIVILTAIGFKQDVHEYGKHLNAFFTLGLTKLFTTLIMFPIKSKHLLHFGVGNSMDSTCHNTYDFPDERILKDYYNAETRHDNTCPSWGAEQLLSYGIRDRIVQCSKSSMVENNYIGVDIYDIESVFTLWVIWHAQCTIWVTAVAMVFARIVVYKITRITKCQQIYVFILEFLVISVPAILSVTILNPYVEYIIVFIFIAFAILVIRSKCLTRAAQREFEYGRRPFVLTFQRSSVNFLTVLCILAVDFNSFPKSFRKTKGFGAGLMDTGIGLIVITMGLVQSKPKRLADMRRLLITVSVLLLLGLARTVVITAIDYKQDEHEYGTHLNAFFTLGLTKLFTTLIMFPIKSKHLLHFGVAIMVLHEIALQLGISSFVMDGAVKRTNFFTSNREGLCSLPGFVGLSLISTYLGQWIKGEDVINFNEVKAKLKRFFYCGVLLWLIVIFCTVITGVARVTCNLCYAAWQLALVTSMVAFSIFMFNIVCETLYPDEFSELKDAIENESEKRLIQKPANKTVDARKNFLLESVNYNGLVYFLLANVLTGAVNIFLKTEECTNIQSVFILLGYMLITSAVASFLYHNKIRIA